MKEAKNFRSRSANTCTGTAAKLQHGGSMGKRRLFTVMSNVGVMLPSHFTNDHPLFVRSKTPLFPESRE